MPNKTTIPASFIVILLSTLIAFAANQGSVSISNIPLFGFVVFLIFVIQWLVFVPSFINRTEHFFDLTGSLTFISASLFTLMAIPEIYLRDILITLLVVVWATRLGSFLFFISILDVFLNSFFRLNLTGFLPNFLSFLLPLILGFVGLYFIRIEYSGIKNLDLLNKHINTNNFNAVLSLLIIFIIIKSIPPILSWFVIDASFAGDTKDVCTGSGACWTYI